MEIMRHTPYPPSFRRIAAKIILPAIGASTWALGSQRCDRNIGSFTKNPLISKILNVEGISIDVWSNINDDSGLMYISVNIKNIGVDATTV
jgi:hypothetical protein